MTLTSHLDLGALHPFHAAGILGVPDVQVAATLLRIGGQGVNGQGVNGQGISGRGNSGQGIGAQGVQGAGGRGLSTATAADAEVTLAAALCVRALRAGSVCIDLAADPVMWTPEVDAERAEDAADHALVDADPGSSAPVNGAPDPEALAWPDPAQWLASARRHPLVADGTDGPLDRPLRLIGSLLYLQRYWLDEQVIRRDLAHRAQGIDVDPAVLESGLARLFPSDEPDRQRLAAATAVLRRATIVAGGPGTGKTTTVARIIALLREVHGPALTVALAAPTGKAAARLAEAVVLASGDLGPADQQSIGTPASSTLHRLLGWRPDTQGRFRHDRSNPLPHDVVIVDETSMVSLPLMARLLEAVRPDARLVLVGDPDQLASIDAGAVLGDLVAAPPLASAPATGPEQSLATGPPTGLTTGPSAGLATGLANAPATGLATEPSTPLAAACPREVADGAVTRAGATGVVVLDRNWRFGEGIGELADAIRSGDSDSVLAVLAAGYPEVEFCAADASHAARMPAPEDAVGAVRRDIRAQAQALVGAAAAGDAGTALAHLEDHRVLCAHREGPHGVSHWSALIAAWTEDLVDRADPASPWYPGQPLLVTRNDYPLGLFNGDTGVVVSGPGGEIRAAFARGTEHVLLPPARLDTVTTLHAMTIHRGQGSQFQTVTVVLPPAESPLLTRELLYTAVTRAREHVRLIGTTEAVRAAVSRPVRRASGLRRG